MTIRLISALAVLGALVLAGCTAPVGGPWPREGVVSPGSANPPVQVVQADALRLTIESERRLYVVGEPVYLTLRLTNTTARPQRLFGSLDPSDGAVDIIVTGPDGRGRDFGPLGEGDNAAGIFVDLAPGETIGDIVPVFFGGTGWTFTEPGRHVVSAIFQSPDGQGRFQRAPEATIAIDVQASDAGSALIRGNEDVATEAGKFLTWQSGDHLVQGQEALSTLAARAPDSPIASYAHAAFARSFSEPFANYLTRQVRPADCRQALRSLALVDDSRIVDNVRFQLAIVEARCAANGNDINTAVRRVEDARNIAGNRPEFRGLLNRLRPLQEYLGGVE